MTISYTAPLPAPTGLPPRLVVRVFVMRDDEKKLSAEELEALARLYPQTDPASRALVERAITRAKRSKPAPSKASPAKRTTTKAAPKRKAAKKPTRSRAAVR